MPVTDRDLQGLTYFARRLREDTHGRAPWDEAGTYAVFKTELAGTNLLIALERVIGHATDPEARTPGAIKRPFTPEPVKTIEREVFDESETCAVCYERRPKCRELAARADDGHAFIAVDRNRAVASSPAPKTLRQAITPTRTWPKPPPLDELAAPAVKADQERVLGARSGVVIEEDADA